MYIQSHMRERLIIITTNSEIKIIIIIKSLKPINSRKAEFLSLHTYKAWTDVGLILVFSQQPWAQYLALGSQG